MSYSQLFIHDHDSMTESNVVLFMAAFSKTVINFSFQQKPIRSIQFERILFTKVFVAKMRENHKL